MPPLRRSAADVVLDAVAGEDLDVAVVHGDREVDGELALRDAQHAAHAVIEVELVGGVVELGLGDGPDVRSLRHRVLDWPSGALSASLHASRSRRLRAVFEAEAGRFAVTVADSSARPAVHGLLLAVRRRHACSQAVRSRTR